MNFSLPIVLKFAGDGQEGEFTGLASTWNRDRHGDTIARGAFAESMAAVNAKRAVVPLLDNHRTDRQIGVIQDGTETDEGLLVTGRIVKGTSSADRAYQLAQAGALSLSVGFLPREAEPQAGGGFLHRKADLVEVSAVSTPSNRESRILSIRSLEFADASDFERMLRDGEMPPLPRRLAAKVARACMSIIDGDESEQINPADEAAFLRAVASFKTLS